MAAYLQYASFLIRLWWLASQPEDGTPGAMHSEVEHIQSGRSWRFSTLEQLMTFLTQQSKKEGGVEWIEMQAPGT